MEIKAHEHNGAGIHPQMIEWLIPLIEKQNPKHILEFGLGGGISARTFLNNSQADLVSVEDLYKYYLLSKNWNDYGDRLLITDYDNIPDRQYDIVLVDGRRREEVLILHWDKIKKGALIVLDDVRRPLEQHIVNDVWPEKLNFNTNYLNIARGIAFGYK